MDYREGAKKTKQSQSGVTIGTFHLVTDFSDFFASFAPSR